MRLSINYVCIVFVFLTAPQSASASGKEGDDDYLSLLQFTAAVKASRVTGSRLDCSDLQSLADKVGAFNDSSAALQSVVDQLTASVDDIVSQVNDSLNTATEGLSTAKSATAAAAVFGSGGDAAKLVDKFIAQVTPKLEEVQAKLPDLVDEGMEKLSALVETFNASAGDAADSYLAALDMVTSLCQTGSADLVSTEPRSKKSRLVSWPFGGQKAKSDYDKADAAISKANESAEGLLGMIDDLNASASEQLDSIFEYVNTTLLSMKETILPKALESLDGKVPAPVLAIVTQQANDAIDKLLQELEGVKVSMLESIQMVSELIENAKAQLGPAFAAAGDLSGVTQAAREEASSAKSKSAK